MPRGEAGVDVFGTVRTRSPVEAHRRTCLPSYIVQLHDDPADGSDFFVVGDLSM